MLKLITKTLALVATLTLTQAQIAQACISPVSNNSYFEVRFPGTELKMQDGDLVSLSWSDAVIPATAGLKVFLNYDHKILRLVTEESIFADYETPPVGSFGKRYYFKALSQGATTIEIKVIGRDGQIRSDIKQSVDVTKKPVYRDGADLAKCM